MKLIREGLDVGHIRASIAAHRDEFKQELYREKFPDTADYDSPSVYLRMVPFPIRSFQDTLSNFRVINWSAAQLLPNFMAALVDLNQLLDGRLARASIVKVMLDREIMAHPYQGPYADRIERYVVCITSLPGDTFKPGELWHVGVGEHFPIEHSDSPADRLYLICDQWKAAAGTHQPAQTPESLPARPMEDHSTTPPAQQSTAAKPRAKARKKPTG
jgi:hypothetical protein